MRVLKQDCEFTRTLARGGSQINREKMGTRNSQLEEMLFLACKLEASARKPGNVHPDASFENSNYEDFIQSAKAIAPILSKTKPESIGDSILNAVEATKKAVAQNTNLGIVLLLAPLASISLSDSISSNIEEILDGMNVEDSKLIYRAINLANPAGMGKSTTQDLFNEPTVAFREIMSSVAERDSIARAYKNGFSDLIPESQSHLENQAKQLIDNWEQTIIRWQLELMAKIPDTLILRKCGQETSQQSAAYAKEIIDANWPNKKESQELLVQFDDWLRADGNKRNPGTTADLIAAKIFILLRETCTQPKTQTFIQEMLNNVE